jgi:hypothetical protein
MKFVKALNEVGRSYIHIDLEGLELPQFNFDAKPLLDFAVGTYEVLKANKSEEEWNRVFKIPEEFLKTLTPEEQQQIAAAYIYCHWIILQSIEKIRPVPENNRALAQQIDLLNAEVFTKLEDELSDVIANLDITIDLIPKLVSFTNRNVPIQQFEGVGERPQDSADMTFYRNDVVQLTALAIASKMFSPITGIFMVKFRSCGIDNLFKEIHCAVIYKKLIANRFQELSDKLIHYIGRVIKPHIKEPNPTNLYNGFTPDVLQQHIYAQMLTRKLVIVDLYKENTNLVTFLNASAKETASSQQGGGNKTSIAYRKDIKELSSSAGEDGNGSVLEQESSTSDKTADFDIIVKFVVNDIRKNFASDYELDDDVISAAEAYYLNTVPPMTLNTNNSYLLSIMFGNQLCGAKTVEMLCSQDLCLLIPTMQMYFIKHHLYDLVHVVSAVNTGGPKTALSGAEKQLAASWSINYAYANCDKRFPYEINGMTWSTSLNRMINDVINTVHVYHTAPAIWQLLGQENMNGKEYIAPVTLSESVCNFILQQNS